MKNPLRFVKKGISILAGRLREQGVRGTFTWIYGRGLPKLTGVPLLRYSTVTDSVWVGPQFGRRGRDLLARAGVDYVVNMRGEFDDAAHGLSVAHYCHLPTVDDAAPSLAHLEEGVNFIYEAVAAGGTVYIHCAGGIGRAPTMAAAYFISTGMTPEDAVALIARTRPFIRMTPPQYDVLHAYAESLQADVPKAEQA